MGKRKSQVNKGTLIKLSSDEIITMHEFAFYLRTVRTSLKLTSEEMAEICGTSKSSILMYEREERVPDDPYPIIEGIREFIRDHVRKVNPQELKRQKSQDKLIN